jgi:hypothetical protein
LHFTILELSISVSTHFYLTLSCSSIAPGTVADWEVGIYGKVPQSPFHPGTRRELRSRWESECHVVEGLCGEGRAVSLYFPSYVPDNRNGDRDSSILAEHAPGSLPPLHRKGPSSWYCPSYRSANICTITLALHTTFYVAHPMKISLLRDVAVYTDKSYRRFEVSYSLQLQGLPAQKSQKMKALGSVEHSFPCTVFTNLSL